VPTPLRQRKAIWTGSVGESASGPPWSKTPAYASAPCAGTDDAIGRLTVVVQLPVSGGIGVGQVQDGPLEKAIGHCEVSDPPAGSESRAVAGAILVELFVPHNWMFMQSSW
jgi:hypothetical protein